MLALEHDDPFDHVLELADVAGKRVPVEGSEQLRDLAELLAKPVPGPHPGRGARRRAAKKDKTPAGDPPAADLSAKKQRRKKKKNTPVPPALQRGWLKKEKKIL